MKKDGQAGRPPLLARLGMRTREQRAWALYDWANSAMVTVVVTAVFPIFFSSYAAAGLSPGTATFRHSVATSIGLTVIALLAPLLGAMSDRSANKKGMLGIFMGIGATAVALMFFIGRGEWMFAAVLFVLANIGANGSFVFYDSLLPHVAEADELDRVSAGGYALGYIGGGLLLAGALAMITYPASFGFPETEGLTPARDSLPARVSFLSVAVWWVVFSIPLFFRIPEPPAGHLTERGRKGGVLREVVSRLSGTFRDLRRYPDAFLMLMAFLVYNDGIGTIIRMAAIYAKELGIDRGAIIGAILMVQFIGFPFAFLFGSLAGRIGTRRAILIGLAVYAGISVLSYFMTSAIHFFILAGLVGMVQGGTQALSRSLFGSMIPRHESGKFFGLFAVFEKFAGIFGPGIFALMILLTGSSRGAILTVVAFFVAGAVLLCKVDVKEGRRIAKSLSE